MDVLVLYIAHPCQHPVTMLSLFAPKVSIKQIFFVFLEFHEDHTIIHHSFADDLRLQMSAPPDRISELLNNNNNNNNGYF